LNLRGYRQKKKENGRLPLRRKRTITSVVGEGKESAPLGRRGKPAKKKKNAVIPLGKEKGEVAHPGDGPS